jgi:hypothetical protein
MRTVRSPELEIPLMAPMQPAGGPSLEIRTVPLLVGRLNQDHDDLALVPAADGVPQRGFVDHFLGDPECLFASSLASGAQLVLADCSRG